MSLVVVLIVMFVCCLKRFRERNVRKIWNELKNKTSVDVKAMRGRTYEEKVQMSGFIVFNLYFRQIIPCVLGVMTYDMISHDC